jgi:Tol biopolymer transport system component/C-terminal processing protease CtpA/Prc
MSRTLIPTALFGFALSLAAFGAGKQTEGRPHVDPKPSFAEPGISPDGREIAFVSGGDIWSVPATGGDAHLLVSHAASESRPLFSPDGRWLAFVSTRTGSGDLYVLRLETGDIARLTFDDGPEQLDGWSADSRFAYFSSSSLDVAGMNDLFRVPATGGTPMQVSADRYVNEFFAAPSPDGTAVAFVARGNASGQWWRHGHSHLDESELWLLRDAATPQYERLMPRGAKQLWPMWSADGRSLYFVSDRDGAENLWVRPIAGGDARPVTQFRDGRLLWPSVTRDGKTVAFERSFGIWTADTATGSARQVKITRRGAPAGPGVQHQSLTGDFSDLALSPDGKKMAFVARGEVFAASAKDGGEAARVTRTSARESSPVWAPDSRKLAYVSNRDGDARLFRYDFGSNAETPLTRGPGRDEAPRFSPDGKALAFVRNQRELRVLDLEAKQERLIAEGRFGDALGAEQPVFSPDGRWIAILAIGDRSFTNVQLAPAVGGALRPVSVLANVFAGGISFAPDGTYLLFDTRQRTENAQLARVDLILRTPKFREDLFRDLFQPEPARPSPKLAQPAGDKPAEPSPEPKVKEPVEVVFDGIRERLTLVPVGVDVGSQAISPDGTWVVMIAGAEGQQNLYAYSLDELARERPVARQLTSTSAGKASLQITPDSKEVLYLEGGRVRAVPIERGDSRAVAVTAEMDVAFTDEKLEVFEEAWSLQRDNFFDAKYNGVDWATARQTFAPYAAGAQTPDELRRVISLMIGELNASHLGVSAPGGGEPATGRLGLRFDRAEYERAGRLRITRVVALGPAALSRQIAQGDYLLAVDGEPVSGRTNLDGLLDHKIGKRVALAIGTAEGANRREVVVKPVDRNTEKALLYREWVEGNRAYVEKASAGRLGYVHMLNMSQAALDQLHVDLDADNQTREGVVVDIRNNSGGFVNVYAIDVLARRGYLNMTLRGLPTAPARTVLGQRSLERPTILVTNQHSLSDAEDFTEGYRALKLGTVVGEPTAGWIIYTWNARLIDGSTFRLPRMRITDSQGRDMEMHPRPVDVTVEHPIGESLAGKDTQLDVAVTQLLKQIGAR